MATPKAEQILERPGRARAPRPRLTDRDYQLLLRFRTDLRRFHRWSEERAADAGLTPMQHQMLLAVRGHSDDRGPTIQDVATALLLRHNSAVELVDRAERAGLVRRVADPDDRRAVRLRLTPLGSRRLGELSQSHVEQIRRLRLGLEQLWPGD
jgi:DNA-binding MarR family transcriptional regulator